MRDHFFQIGAKKLEQIKKRSKGPIPYDSFPLISMIFVEEMRYRASSAMMTFELSTTFDKKKSKDFEENYENDLVSYVALNFSIVEIATILDGRGKLSIKLSKNRSGVYIVDRARLKRLLPSLSSKEFERIYKKISDLISKNSELVERILYTRHNKLAHASIPNSVFDSSLLYQFSFPKRKFRSFINKFESIAYSIIFGINIS